MLDLVLPKATSKAHSNSTSSNNSAIYGRVTYGLGPYSARCHNHAEKIPKIYTKIYTKIYQNILYIFIHIWIYLAIFWYFFGMVMTPKKIPKIYPNISKIYPRYPR